MAMKARMDRNTPTSLTVQAKMWPTPRATDQYTPDKLREDGRTKRGTGADLGAVATASHHAPTTTPAGPNGPGRAVLNPRFVEALMGLPNGWLTPSTWAATGSSRNVPERHGSSSRHDWLSRILGQEVLCLAS